MGAKVVEVSGADIVMLRNKDGEVVAFITVPSQCLLFWGGGKKFCVKYVKVIVRRDIKFGPHLVCSSFRNLSVTLCDVVNDC